MLFPPGGARRGRPVYLGLNLNGFTKANIHERT